MAAMSGVDGRSFQLQSPTYTNVGAMGNPGWGAAFNLQKAAPFLYAVAIGTVVWWAWKKWS